eukprot:360919-Chlamydomonas_euryale.AAC.4
MLTTMRGPEPRTTRVWGRYGRRSCGLDGSCAGQRARAGHSRRHQCMEQTFGLIQTPCNVHRTESPSASADGHHEIFISAGSSRKQERPSLHDMCAWRAKYGTHAANTCFVEQPQQQHTPLHMLNTRLNTLKVLHVNICRKLHDLSYGELAGQSL